MLLQLEILIFLSSGIYIFVYGGTFVRDYIEVYKEKKRQRAEIIKQRIEKRAQANAIAEQEPKEAEPLTSGSVPADQKALLEASEKIKEIIKRVEVNISRGYLDSARILVIEGLAFNKNNKELNLLLADIYEREKKYQNAEYIYRDLLDVYPKDDFILQRLGNVYSLREKLDKAFECYEGSHENNRANIEILDILAHLALELGYFKKSAKYAGLFLKQKPRNPEKLGIKGFSLEKIGKYADAIKTYKELLEIQPYNSEIIERLNQLESQSLAENLDNEDVVFDDK